MESSLRINERLPQVNIVIKSFLCYVNIFQSALSLLPVVHFV